MPTKEDLLWSLKVKDLRKLAKDNRVTLVKEGFLWNSRASTKEDIIEILLESSRITKKKIETIIEPPKREKAPPKKTEVKRKAEKATPRTTKFEGVLKKVKQFDPYRKPKKEKELEAMLVSYLRAFYPDLRTQLTYGRARIDAQIGKVGIELKFQPSAGAFDRLYGQIEKYLKHLKCVIVVIGYEKSKEDTRYFKKRLKERGWLKDRVFVVSVS